MRHEQILIVGREMNSKNVKNPFGVLNGETVLVDAVPSGLACNCVCHECGEKLVAKKGDINIHHFAHISYRSCERAFQLGMIERAKKILQEAKRIELPEVKFIFSKYRFEEILYPSKIIELDEVTTEYRCNDEFPDLVVYRKGRPLLIEIVVTHAVDTNKKNRIKELGISALEINLRWVLKSKDYKEIADLEDYIIGSPILKSWIFNGKAHAKQKEFLQESLNQNTAE